MNRPCRKGSREIVAYARVSTQEQAEHDLSLPAQIAAVRKYAADNSLNIVGEFEERGVSGTDDNRPAFQRMLGQVMLPSSTVSMIVVVSSSRFMRNAAKARWHKDKLKQLGVRVVAIQSQTTDDPSGHLAEGIHELFDQFESEMNGCRTLAAMRENARRGFFNGSRPPFGFRIVKVPGPNGGPKNKLEVDGAEADIARELFQQYVSGRGAKAVARALNQRGLLYRGRPWNRDRVLRTVDEPALVGRYYWGRIDSKSGSLRAEEDWILLSVPRVLDDDLFALASEARRRRDPIKNPGRASSSPLLLSGLAKCGRCGKSLQLVTATGGNGAVHRYYLCRVAARAGAEACRGRRVREDALDRAVLLTVGEELFTVKRCEQILRDYVEAEGGLRKRATEQRRLLERERNELDRRLGQLYEHIETNSKLQEHVSDRLRELNMRRTEVVRQLGRLSPATPIPPHLYGLQTIERFRARLKAAFLTGDRGLARPYLHRLLEAVTVGDDEIVISGRTDGMLTLMAGSTGAASSQPDKPSPDVHANVVGWRAREDSNL